MLGQGKVGLLPTDTIYGISASALNEQAVAKIHELKGRKSNKPLIVLISDIKMLGLLSISANQAKLAKPFWPGALSLEFKTPNAPKWLHRGLYHFAIRMPKYPELLKLIKAVGPIVSTSANLQGELPANSVDEAKKIFGDKLDFYVEAGSLKAQPSTLAIEFKGNLRVVRQGAVKIR